MTHLTIQEILDRAKLHEAKRLADPHAINEQACFEQAKKELGPKTAWGLIMQRAQAIKGGK